MVDLFHQVIGEIHLYGHEETVSQNRDTRNRAEIAVRSCRPTSAYSAWVERRRPAGAGLITIVSRMASMINEAKFRDAEHFSWLDRSFGTSAYLHQLCPDELGFDLRLSIFEKHRQNLA
jgi:hypothetical protein